jgi:hypothetical protein
MVNKWPWVGMLVMVMALVFGMTVIGCNDGSTGGGNVGNPFVGTWTAYENGMTVTMIFTSDMQFSYRGVGYGQSINASGTYTVSGNTATITASFQGQTGTSIATISSDGSLIYMSAVFTKRE